MTPKYKLGSYVFFTGRTQKSHNGCKILEIDANMFNVMYKLDDSLWWNEGNITDKNPWGL